MVIMHPATVVLILTLHSIMNVCQGAALYSWTVEEEDAICACAEGTQAFCGAKGVEDEHCKTLAAKVNGTDAKCYDQHVCTFTKGGAAAYVTCNSLQKDYSISRNCVNNVGIAQPTPGKDLSNSDLTYKFYANPEKGKYETPNIKSRLLCKDFSLESCEGQEIRNDLLKNFHTKDRIGDLCGGFCMVITDIDNSGNQQTINRCVFVGTYFNPASKQRERFRWHVFNHGKDTKVVVIGYWGKENTLDTVEIPE